MPLYGLFHGGSFGVKSAFLKNITKIHMFLRILAYPLCLGSYRLNCNGNIFEGVYKHL